MSGLYKNKLTNIQLRALLERIDECSAKLGREFKMDHSTVLYYRRKLEWFGGDIEAVLDSRQRMLIYKREKQKGNTPRFQFKAKEKCEAKKEKTYADYLAVEADKKFNYLISKGKNEKQTRK